MLQLAQPKDRDSINALAGQVHALHVAWRPDIYETVEEMYSQDRFDSAVRDRQLYVAKLENQVVGYVLVKIRRYDWPGVVNRTVLVLDEICVDEFVRRHGIGTAIMQDVRALGRAFGCTDLQLGVYPQNDSAVSFYQKNGLKIRSIDMQMKL